MRAGDQGDATKKARYIADLNRRLDEAERDTIRGELFTGSVVTAAQSFLKLGIATTVPHGVTLMSRGDLALIPFLMFLIAATRVYDPIGSMFANMAAVSPARCASSVCGRSRAKSA